MKSENLITFGLGEFLDDIREVMAKKDTGISQYLIGMADTLG